AEHALADLAVRLGAAQVSGWSRAEQDLAAQVACRSWVEQDFAAQVAVRSRAERDLAAAGGGAGQGRWTCWDGRVNRDHRDDRDHRDVRAGGDGAQGGDGAVGPPARMGGDRDGVAWLRARIRAGEDPLGQAFCRIRPPERRRSSGQTFTPPAVVDSMVWWAARALTPARVVDPGAGSARFLAAAGRRWPEAELIGLETDPLAALIGPATLAAP